MNFTPNEIQNFVFRRSLFGLHQNQVLDVLVKIVEDYAEQIRESVRSKHRLEEMQEKLDYYRSIEQLLQNSLIVAQKASDELVVNARKQAENIVRESQLRAREIEDEANRSVVEAIAEREQIKRETMAYRSRITSLLDAQRSLLAGFDRDDPDARVSAFNRDAAEDRRAVV